MKNTLNVCFEKKEIIMDRTFAAKAKDTRSDEYIKLQEVRRDYPDYTVKTRSIKRNPNKKTYRGLTYAYMMNYILTNSENEEEMKETLAEFNKLLEIGRCHGKGKCYPVIKKWFLNRYEEIEEFGMAA